MGRRSIPSTNLSAAVRKHFGLTQTELGYYLGLTRGQVAHVEAGRHLFASAAPAPPETADPAAHLAPPDAAPLQARRAICQHHAAKLRREIKALTQTLEYARRWQAALPTLLAQAAADLDGDVAARYHLLRLRAEAFETEAAGLAALLGAAGSEE